MGEAVSDKDTEQDTSILRLRLAKLLRVGEKDVLRWMFWEGYGKDGPDEEQLASLKHEVMDDEWPMFEKMLEDGPPDWWMRLRCRLASKENDFSFWLMQHNWNRQLNMDVDTEWKLRQARERIEKFEKDKNPFLIDVQHAAMDYELLGETEKADACYRKVLDRQLAGRKWPSPA